MNKFLYHSQGQTRPIYYSDGSVCVRECVCFVMPVSFVICIIFPQTLPYPHRRPTVLLPLVHKSSKTRVKAPLLCHIFSLEFLKSVGHDLQMTQSYFRKVLKTYINIRKLLLRSSIWVLSESVFSRSLMAAGIEIAPLHTLGAPGDCKR